MNPYGNAVPVQEISPGIFLVEDASPIGGRRSQAMNYSSPPSPGDNGTNNDYQPDGGGYTPMIFTNGLWLEVLNQPPNPGPTNLWLRLHGTIDGDLYQLLSVTNLLSTNWDLGEILWDADDDYSDFSPVSTTNAMTFYRAHHANPVMQLWNAQDSEELNPTNTSDPGHTGIVSIYNGDQAHPLTNDITAYYTVSGTAQSGIDYSNLPGMLTIPAGQWSVDIVIQPTAAGLKPDQTIILSLVQNTNYLIDTDYAFATNTLFANPAVYPTARGDNERLCPNTQWPFYLQGHDYLGLSLTYTVLTWPAHGTLGTNTLPQVTYTPTNCYEGLDSFTFTVNDGQHTSAPATVTLTVSSQVYAYPVTAQTCRGTPVGVTLNGGAFCNQTVSYAAPTNLAHGSLSGTLPYLTYTPNDANFTGVDSFNYQAIDQCGYPATATASITVGDAGIAPDDQTVMAGIVQPVNIALTASSPLGCTNTFGYVITGNPGHGTLSNTPPNVTYTPYANYEGLDSFQFTASDGVWTSAIPATVTIYVVAGPTLMADCDPFKVGPSIKLEWTLDSTVQQMEQQYNFIHDYKVYRSAVSGGNYTCIYTNTDLSQMSYLDTNVMAGQTNYYVVTFESVSSGRTYESPRSNEIVATGQNPNDLIAPDATWDVWDITTNHPHIWMGNLRAPFSNQYPNQYANLYPLPNTNWPSLTTWSNNIVLVVPTNSVVLSQVKYSIAIDNDYWLYLNNSTNYIDTFTNSLAFWPAFKTLAPGLHYGTNQITVIIRDEGVINYFSMVVTTNTCGQ